MDEVLRTHNARLAGKSAPKVNYAPDADLASTTVRAEFNRIDILVECHAARLIVAIENKTQAREHGDQLCRYRKHVEDIARRRGSIPVLIYLTPDGSQATDDSWTPLHYKQLADSIRAARDNAASVISNDVSLLIDHYMSLIRRDVLKDNDDLKDLCRNIYFKHRQAVDHLIAFASDFDAVVSVAREVVQSEATDFVQMLGGTAVVRFVPIDIMRVVPKIAGSDSWLTWRFDRNAKDRSQFRLILEADKCSEPSMLEKRSRVLQAILDNHDLGVKLAQDRSAVTMRSGGLLRLSKGRSTTLLRLSDDSDADLPAVRSVVSSQLADLRLQIPIWIDVIERAKMAKSV